jgi:anti-anti-sigma regulatory factor
MTSPLQAEVVWDGVVATVTVTGELDITASRALCHRLLEVASAHPDRLVLDLGGLVVADAAAAKVLDDTHKLLDAGCPVVVRRSPTSSGQIFALTSPAETHPAPVAGGSDDDLVARLRVARAQATANYERARQLWQRTESMLAENQTLRHAVREICNGREGSGPAPRDVLQRSEYARLVARLQTMPVIEQAKGIIMAQSACGDSEAFDMLRRASQRSNVPVRELAAQLVAKSAGKPPPSPAPQPRDTRARR